MISRAIGNSLALRVGAWFALASALVIATIGFYLYSALDRTWSARQTLQLTSMAILVQNIMADAPSLERLVEQPDIIGHVLVGHFYMDLWIYGKDGRMLFASSPDAVPEVAWKSIVPPAPAAPVIATKLWQPAPRKTYQLAVTRFSSEGAGIGQGFIILALDVSETMQLLRAFKVNIFFTLPAGLLIAMVIGLLVARRGLRPLVHVSETAHHITANHLDERIELKDMPRELQSLVGSFNTMLDRLENSFRRLSEFSADLAHELRTPLTSLLGRSQAALLRQRTPDEYREVLESNVETIKWMSALVSDMLFLARADYARSALAYEQVDLREDVDRLIEFYGIACEERKIGLKAHGRATASVDRTMLRQALSNLLSNAIRHSPDGGSIDVVLDRDERAATVSVVDHGPGIAPEHASRIFDRFYRADPSRSRDSGGTGLGLAIARSIARMHGGDVSVKSEPGKSTAFTLTIPEPPRNRAAKGAVAAPRDSASAKRPADLPKTTRIAGPPETAAKIIKM